MKVTASAQLRKIKTRLCSATEPEYSLALAGNSEHFKTKEITKPPFTFLLKNGTNSCIF